LRKRWREEHHAFKRRRLDFARYAYFTITVRGEPQNQRANERHPREVRRACFTSAVELPVDD
jgi:hypothetical protein